MRALLASNPRTSEVIMPVPDLLMPSAQAEMPPRNQLSPSLQTFESEHDRIAARLGAFLAHQAKSSRERHEPGMARTIREQIRVWASSASVRGVFSAEQLDGLRMAVESFTNTELLVLVEDLIRENEIAQEADGHTPERRRTRRTPVR
jgi:hypothetical protein